MHKGQIVGAERVWEPVWLFGEFEAEALKAQVEMESLEAKVKKLDETAWYLRTEL